MLTQEEKEKMIVALRGTSVAKENITEEYKKTWISRNVKRSA